MSETAGRAHHGRTGRRVTLCRPATRFARPMRLRLSETAPMQNS